jgi:hypothetical protein
MKIYHWLLLFLLLSCDNEKKPSRKAQIPQDTSGSFYSMLRLYSDGDHYKDFLHCKKLLQISDTGTIENDYEIRLYFIGGTRVPSCFRYMFRNDKWRGECIYFQMFNVGEGDNQKTNFLITKDSIRPEYGWEIFIKNLTDNGLLDMPTNEAIAEELLKLSKVYPEKETQILESVYGLHGNLDKVIEIISKDHYDFRLYEDWELHNADEYKGLLMFARLNKLIKEMTITKYETYP